MVWATSTFSSSAVPERSCLHPRQRPALHQPEAAAGGAYWGHRRLQRLRFLCTGRSFSHATFHGCKSEELLLPADCRLGALGPLGFGQILLILGSLCQHPFCSRPSFVYCSPSLPFDSTNCHSFPSPICTVRLAIRSAVRKFVKARARTGEKGVQKHYNKGCRSVTQGVHSWSVMQANRANMAGVIWCGAISYRVAEQLSS